MDTSAKEYLMGAIEALLFISEKPVTLAQIAEVMQEGVGTVDVKGLVGELIAEYESQQRGMVIVEIAGGYQMLSSPHYVSFVRNFFKTKVREKLSRPALETLAIVAYKQPVSRGDIELVRGVNSDGVGLHLLDKSLIKIVGKKDVPGRPYLYGTSKLFLEYFGLKSLNDLPKLEDVSLLLANAEQAAVLSAEGTGVEENPASASQALDEAEARAEQENRAAPFLEQDHPPIGESLTAHVQAARQQAGELIDHSTPPTPASPVILTEAMNQFEHSPVLRDETGPLSGQTTTTQDEEKGTV